MGATLLLLALVAAGEAAAVLRDGGYEGLLAAGGWPAPRQPAGKAAALGAAGPRLPWSRAGGHCPVPPGPGGEQSRRIPLAATNLD